MKRNKFPKPDKQKRSVIIIHIILQILVLATLVDQFRIGNYHNVFISVLTLVLFNIPHFVNNRTVLRLPNLLEIIILMFIFSAEILGEIQSFYTIFKYWDTILHTINGFLMAAIGFAMIDVLNNHPKFHIQLSPMFVAFVSFCFSMTIGVIWEFFEFGMDYFFLTDMQKDFIVNNLSSVALNPDGINNAVIIRNITGVTVHYIQNGIEQAYEIAGGYLDIGIIDTMKDLLVNCIGAIVFSAFGAIYIKNREKNTFVTKFIPDMSKKIGEK